MVKVVFGDEPYLVTANIKRMRQSISLSCPEMNYRRFSGFGEEVLDFIETVPFVDPVKLCEVDVEKSAELVSMKDLLIKDIPTCQLLVRLSKPDKRLKVMKELASAGVLHEYKKISRKELVSFIIDKAKKGGKDITPEAAEEIAQRGHYERPEVSLYFFENTVEDLCVLCPGDISLGEVRMHMADNEADNVFALAGYLNNRDITGIQHQLPLILESVSRDSSKSVIGTLSLLLREYRVAYKAVICGGSLKDIGVNFVNIRSRNEKHLVRSMRILTDAIRGIQDGTVDEKDAILTSCMAIMVSEND